MSNISIFIKEFINQSDLRAIEELNGICTENEDIYLKLELDYKIHLSELNKERTSDNVNEFLYYVGDTLVAYLGICRFSGNTGELTGVVHPLYRRKGIFKTLYHLAVKECRKREFKKILLVCDHKGKEGLGFLNSVGAVYDFSEYEMKLQANNLKSEKKSITLRKMDYYKAFSKEKIIDLSQVVEDDMPVYPGDVKTNLFQNKYLSVNEHNNHRLEISMHTGTHIDSPMHLTESNAYISELPLEPFIGRGCILDVRDKSVISFKKEYEKLVEENSIILLYTGFDRFYGTKEYYEKHPVLDMEFCEFLIRKNIKMVGMDTPSPDIFPFEVHKALMRNNIYIAENLTNLNNLLELRSFEVIALPLKIKADGSLVRVAARILT